MVITLRKGTKQKEIAAVTEKIKGLGYKPHVSKGEADITIIGMIGDRAEKYKEIFEAMDAVEHVSEIQKPYKLASREFKKENTVIKVSKNV
ncbi:MAG: hypothetical protein LE179_01350, partial [Endomicrobium sp.]|nr:hypothetical protein [Endomicrobium sp.]